MEDCYLCVNLLPGDDRLFHAACCVERARNRAGQKLAIDQRILARQVLQGQSRVTCIVPTGESGPLSNSIQVQILRIMLHLQTNAHKSLQCLQQLRHEV